MLTLVWVFTLQIYLSWHFLLSLQCSGCSQYRFIYLGTFCYACVDLGIHNTDLFILALSVMLVLVWVFTIQIYLSWHLLLGLCWSGCSQYRFIYLGTFCYACVDLGIHNTDLFILALSVMLVLVWVFTIQMYLSWHLLLGLCWSGCSKYRFIYLGTFCYAGVDLGVHNTDVFILALYVMLTLVWVFTIQIYLSWHFLLCLHSSGCSQYRFIYLCTFCFACVDLGIHNTDLFILALSVMLVLVWVFTLQIHLSWHLLLGLCWSGCSQYRFIYLGTFYYACVDLGVHNTDVFILALYVMLTLIWVFTIQIYLSWHFLLCLCWSGSSQCRFIYLGTFCYACVGLGLHNTDLFILALSVMLTLVWVFTIQIYLYWHFLLCLHWSGCSQYRFIYLCTFCYAYIGLGVHTTDLFILALSVILTMLWVFTIQIYLSWHFLLCLC